MGNVPKDCEIIEQTCEATVLWNMSQSFTKFAKRKKSNKDKLDIHESVHLDIIMKVTNKMQLYMFIYYSYSVLHVLGDVFTHHQEHLTVFTYLVVFTQVAAGWCHGWVKTKFQLIQYSQVLLIVDENFAQNM